MKHERTIDDPVFGNLSFEDGGWICYSYRGSKDFMLTVEAPETGPSDAQRQFFQHVMANLSDYSQTCLAFIAKQAYEPVDVRALSIYSLNIGTDDECARSIFTLEFSDEAADLIHEVDLDLGRPFVYGCSD